MRAHATNRNPLGWTAAWVLSLLSALLANAQASAPVSVSGVVLPAFHLEAGQPGVSDPTVTATASRKGADTVLIEVTFSGSDTPVWVRVPLLLHTNAAGFILRGFFHGPPNKGYVSLDEAQAAGNGRLVIPGALAGFQSQPSRLGENRLLATGSRISAGGSFRSPNNALASTMEVYFAPRARSETKTFRLRIARGSPRKLATGTRAEGGRSAMEKVRILVVDDDLGALELVANILESFHAQPKCVLSSRAAIELNREREVRREFS